MKIVNGQSQIVSSAFLQTVANILKLIAVVATYPLLLTTFTAVKLISLTVSIQTLENFIASLCNLLQLQFLFNPAGTNVLVGNSRPITESPTQQAEVPTNSQNNNANAPPAFSEISEEAARKTTTPPPVGEAPKSDVNTNISKAQIASLSRPERQNTTEIQQILAGLNLAGQPQENTLTSCWPIESWLKIKNVVPEITKDENDEKLTFPEKSWVALNPVAEVWQAIDCEALMS
ncbi:MAG: hypothetical protein LBD72_02905 [Puniceicoccales bacterium]|jgi:hypothetical protein|nr:hypothetical protein [Puniceicoccales bacterium]